MKTRLTITILLTLFALLTQFSHAGTATWKGSRASKDWNTATNWNPATVPNGPLDVAKFMKAQWQTLSVSGDIEVNQIRYLEPAGYTITINAPAVVTLSGPGIQNLSTTTQTLITSVDALGNAATLQFTNTATASDGTVFINNGGIVSGAGGGATKFFNSSTGSVPGGDVMTNNGGGVSGASGGQTEFFDTSTAYKATLNNNPGAVDGASGGVTQFYDSSSASYSSLYFVTANNNGGTVSGAGGGATQFFNNATAGNATFTNSGAAIAGNAGGGFVQFFDTSTAGSGVFTTGGGLVSGAFSAFIQFFGDATGGAGTFTNSGGIASGAGGGLLEFHDTSSAGSGIYINQDTTVAGAGGGDLRFFDSSDGGTARIEVFGLGDLDISSHSAGVVTIGSIEGSGRVFLGGNSLSVGSNNLSTTLSGVIQDGGIAGGTRGSLSKIGTGTLTLARANTYTGRTTVSSGSLVVSNVAGSATGPGSVKVTASTLGGTGIMNGPVTMGASTGAAAVLAPGISGPGVLTIKKALTFAATGSYACELDSNAVTADQVLAQGVVVSNGALISFVDLGAGTLSPGTTFTIISNTSATPIAGVFSNLPDSSSVTVGSNTYLISYEGGTGNDLTLTVQ